MTDPKEKCCGPKTQYEEAEVEKKTKEKLLDYQASEKRVNVQPLKRQQHLSRR